MLFKYLYVRAQCVQSAYIVHNVLLYVPYACLSRTRTTDVIGDVNKSSYVYNSNSNIYLYGNMFVRSRAFVIAVQYIYTHSVPIHYNNIIVNTYICPAQV